MHNEYALLQDQNDSNLLHVEGHDAILGHVCLLPDGWHYKLANAVDWSSIAFGSEYEAVEFVFVDLDLLKINQNGIVVTHVENYR